MATGKIVIWAVVDKDGNIWGDRWGDNKSGVMGDVRDYEADNPDFGPFQAVRCEGSMAPKRAPRATKRHGGAARSARVRRK